MLEPIQNHERVTQSAGPTGMCYLRQMSISLVIAIPTLLLLVLNLSVWVTCGIHCYATTKVNCSFAAPQQRQPLLLRLWRVISPSAANTKTATRILATWRHGVVTGLKQGRAIKPLRTTHRSGNPRGSHYTYILQTYSVRNISVDDAVILRTFASERIPVEQQLTIILCFRNTFHTAMVSYCPKGGWTVGNKFVPREGQYVLLQNKIKIKHSQLHLSFF